MSSAETVYAAGGVSYPDYLVRGRGQTTTFPLYRNGALAAPTAAGSTFALHRPDGVTEVVAAAAVTVTGSIATYAIAAGSLPSTLSLGHGYRETWTLVCADGVTRQYYRDAALVLHAAYPVITDADLTAVYSDLGRQRASTVATFQLYIDEAWKRILGRLEMQGVFPEYVVTSWSLREVHIELTLHLICLDFARAQGSRWLELAAQHKKEFEMAWQRLKFVRGTGADAIADSEDVVSPKGVTYMNASPRWGGRRGPSWRGMGGL